MFRVCGSVGERGREGGEAVYSYYPDISRHIQDYPVLDNVDIWIYPGLSIWICLDMFGEWGYPDNPGLSRIIQILDNPGYVWIYPDNTRLRNGGGGGGRGGGADAEHRIKLPPVSAKSQTPQTTTTVSS